MFTLNHLLISESEEKNMADTQAHELVRHVSPA